VSIAAPQEPSEPLVLAIRRTQTGCEIELTAPADLFYFRGHFDDFPILPGVVQVDWALRLAAQHLATGSTRAARMQLKFQHPVRPEMPLTLTLVLAESGGRRQLSFAYRSGALPCASGRIGLEPE
jgi:3-hydroxymyristoyl/3-hydroxydecanoyl-(acyl carrier protein) dehydratase